MSCYHTDKSKGYQSSKCSNFISLIYWKKFLFFEKKKKNETILWKLVTYYNLLINRPKKHLAERHPGLRHSIKRHPYLRNSVTFFPYKKYPVSVCFKCLPCDQCYLLSNPSLGSACFPNIFVYDIWFFKGCQIQTKAQCTAVC